MSDNPILLTSEIVASRDDFCGSSTRTAGERGPSDREEGESACRGRRGGGSASPANFAGAARIETIRRSCCRRDTSIGRGTPGWRAVALASALWIQGATGCGQAPLEDPTPSPEPYQWHLPAGFPVPSVPSDNPMNADKVTLGRYLFYDKRLSGNQTYACATCHEQARAFSDGRVTAVGSTGEIVRRNSMGLTNVAYNSVQTWANPLMDQLEDQAIVPLFGEHPVELGLAGLEQDLLARLRADATYQTLFPAAFPAESDPIQLSSIVKAIAAFERTLLSGNAPYDRYYYQGEASALSESARRGMQSFFSEKFECYHCHAGFNFMDSVTFESSTVDERFYHNTGLYNIDGNGSYPAIDTGLIELTGIESDMGAFRVPTLRNVALSAPYMHDGSIATLEEVLEHYAAGGRTISEGSYAGNGATNPYKSELLRGFLMSDQERDDLLAFFHALTDESFVTDPRFSDPFAADSRATESRR